MLIEVQKWPMPRRTRKVGIQIDVRPMVDALDRMSEALKGMDTKALSAQIKRAVEKSFR